MSDHGGFLMAVNGLALAWAIGMGPGGTQSFAHHGSKVRQKPGAVLVRSGTFRQDSRRCPIGSCCGGAL
jgi:hypothetical protein